LPPHQNQFYYSVFRKIITSTRRSPFRLSMIVRQIMSRTEVVLMSNPPLSFICPPV